jgi:hypothetical protein
MRCYCHTRRAIHRAAGLGAGRAWHRTPGLHVQPLQQAESVMVWSSHYIGGVTIEWSGGVVIAWQWWRDDRMTVIV